MLVAILSPSWRNVGRLSTRVRGRRLDLPGGWCGWVGLHPALGEQSSGGVASNLRASGGEADGIRLRGLPFNTFLVQKLRTAIHNNPEATDDMLAQMMNAFA